MDALRKELEKKRKLHEQAFGGRKYVKRSELEQKEIERLHEEERRELLAKAAKKQSSLQDPSAKGSNPAADGSDPSANGLSHFARPSSDEQKLDQLVLPRAEVIRQLRILKQPITLFGEDDDGRLERLKGLLKAGLIDPDSELMEGQRNDFLRDLYELKKREKHGQLDVRKDKTKEIEGLEEGEKGGGGVGGEREDVGGEGGSDNDKDVKKMKGNFEELCVEDKILVFFKKLLNEWECELEDRPDTEKRTAKGKSMVATFNQCARYLSPLFKMCRKRILPDDIREALMIVVDCCIKRDYLQAMDQYIKLAIGNAPWPIGVTMVGIHERSAREKIYTNSVAHIMNDETTRKYLQSIKRLMTLCQRRYPSAPSKSVEFNSLANGSDLQALLSEEKVKTGNHTGEERLRLTAAPHEDIQTH